LLEIGDLFVVNKADRDGVGDAVRDLEQMLDLGGQRDWRPPVLTTVATTGEGVAAVWEAIGDHRVYLEESGGLAAIRSARLRGEFHRAVVAELLDRAEGEAEGDRHAGLVAEIDAGLVDPWTAARRLLGD
jgi:LAO/AO transport system kinase